MKALLLICLAGCTVAAADKNAEVAAYDQAKPVFDKYWAKCHTKTGKSATKKKLDHFDMTTYPFGGHHAPAMGPTIRKVLGMTGKKPTMPSDNKGAVKGNDLALIKAWADAWDTAHPDPSHAAHHH